MTSFPMVNPKRLVEALGGEWEGGEGYVSCPICQSDHRFGFGDLRIFAVDAPGGFDMMCDAEGCQFDEVVRAIVGVLRQGGLRNQILEYISSDHWRGKRALFRLARDCWAKATPIAETEGEQFFRQYGISAPLPSSLRWLEDAPEHPEGEAKGAIIAETQPRGGILQYSLIERCGRLRALNPMCFGPTDAKGIMLSGPGGTLTVCVSVISGMSLLSGLLKQPSELWATTHHTYLRSFPLPTLAQRIVIAPDDSKANYDAARALAHRASGLGWDVTLHPAPEGKSWNELLNEGRRA